MGIYKKSKSKNAVDALAKTPSRILKHYENEDVSGDPLIQSSKKTKQIFSWSTLNLKKSLCISVADIKTGKHAAEFLKDLNRFFTRKLHKP